MKSICVGRIQTNALEVLKLCLLSNKHGIFLDVRLWIKQHVSGPEAFIATREGLLLRLDVIPALVKALSSVAVKDDFSMPFPISRTRLKTGRRVDGYPSRAWTLKAVP